jgi:hypothetical protein
VALLRHDGRARPELAAVGMSTVDTVTVELAARHLTATPATDEGVLTLELGDGEDTVVISHEIGDREESARRLLAVAEQLRRHALRIRREARQSQGWT